MPVKNLGEESTIIEIEKSSFETPVSPETKGYIWIEAEGFEKRMDEMVSKRVKEQIGKILEERKIIKFRKISDTKAKEEITAFILEMKEKGASKINILEIFSNLNLPPEQIEKVMSGFEQEKKVIKIL